MPDGMWIKLSLPNCCSRDCLFKNKYITRSANILITTVLTKLVTFLWDFWWKVKVFVYFQMETSRKDDILIVVRCEVKNQTEACEGLHTGRYSLRKVGLFMISLVVHDGKYTVVSRVNFCRVSEKG